VCASGSVIGNQKEWGRYRSKEGLRLGKKSSRGGEGGERLVLQGCWGKGGEKLNLQVQKDEWEGGKDLGGGVDMPGFGMVLKFMYP